MHHVHGADVEVVEPVGSVGPVGDAGRAPSCDALVTARPGVALLARAADCVPVLLADPTTGWIAAVHAGRLGLAAGVVPAAVAALRASGADPAVAWVGPHVCGACYEVPSELRDEVAVMVPAARS